MRIVVVGGGRVGLPTAAGLASLGHRVVCCERDDEKRQVAAAGRAPFADDGLDEILTQVVASGHLRFCADVAGAFENDDAAVADDDDATVAAGDDATAAVMVAVPVPSGAGGTDTLDAVAAAFAKVAPAGCVFIVKSTVPPGTCARLRRQFAIDVVSNPEFLREGYGVRDCMSPSRIIVGCDTAAARTLMRRIYAPLIERGVAYLEMNSASAEITKLTANMFLSSRIALLNETADLCRAAGGSVADVIAAIALDARIGASYLRAGVGFGGSCLPKDGRLLLESAAVFGAPMPAVAAVYESNAARLLRLAEEMAAALPVAATVAVWGVAFKPGSDSVCESPAVAVIRRLRGRGCAVRAFDARISAAVFAAEVTDVDFVATAEAAVTDADALVVMNADDGGGAPMSAAAVAAAMRGKTVFDYAGVFERAAAQQAGLTVLTIGAA